MPTSISIQWGPAGQSTLNPRPRAGTEQQIEFASSTWDALWLAFRAAVFSPGAVLARTPTWRWVVGGIVVLLAVSALRRAFWRERLSLDLMQHRYRYSRGYLPHLAIDEGSLDALEGVALDVVARSGSRGGEVITWVVSLVFKDRTLAVDSFASELAGYEYMGALAKRLRIPALDHTGRSEARTAWTEIDKPLAAQPGRPASFRCCLTVPGSRSSATRRSAASCCRALASGQAISSLPSSRCFRPRSPERSRTFISVARSWPLPGSLPWAL